MAADARRVKELFVAALDLPDPQARQAFLERECGGDTDLRQRLDVLLRAHDDPASALSGPLAAVEQATDAYHGSPEDQGAVIAGRYKLLEQIGEGGMGTVWVAEQTQPVRRKVALKLIKAGMDSKTVLSRFAAERQALAVMDHPNIAKVLDGGTTESGRPFFVMEYVKGIPFTRYCDDARLSIRERLALFVPVCQAVQHAHQKGIIHRDLKPSNILVCLYDGKPVPKVIDFGLAKAMHQPLTEQTLYTAHGAIMGTPLYMSPEQAELNNLDLDTRTDIYSLGVILYELLTGTTPLEKQRFNKAAWHEMLRLIKEEEPPRPSARLSGSGSLPSVAAQRQLEPVKLTKLVRGELDWIVMKCLEKDRSRRYETATGLARDLECYLHDEVVEAQPPSKGYRLRKFVRKHRTLLTATATIILLLVAGVAVSAWQAARAMRAERLALTNEETARVNNDQAQQEKQKAPKSAAEANAMIGFFKELTLEARRSVKEGAKWRAKSVDEALAIIDSEKVRALFADYPLAEAEIREWLGSNPQPSIAGFNFSSSFSPTVPGPLPQKAASHTFELSGEAITSPLYPDLRHFERALELRKVHQGPDDPKTLATMHKLGMTYLAQGHTAKALALLSELVARSDATLGRDHDDTLQYKDWLAIAYERAGKPDDSVLLLKDVYVLTKEKLGAESLATRVRCFNLAMAYETAGRIQDALRQRAEHLGLLRKLADTPNDRSVGYALREVARLTDQMQDYTRAELLWREALKILKDDKEILDDVQASLGLCLLRIGKPVDAEPVLRACLAIREKKDPDGWTTTQTKSLLGTALLGQKKYSDAEPLLLAGYDGMKKTPGQIDSAAQGRLIENLERLVQLYEATGKKDKADEWRKKWEAAKPGAKPRAEQR